MSKSPDKTIRTVNGDIVEKPSKYAKVFEEMRALEPGKRIEVMAGPEEQARMRNAIQSSLYKHMRKKVPGYRWACRLMEDRIVITLKPLIGRKRAT